MIEYRLDGKTAHAVNVAFIKCYRSARHNCPIGPRAFPLEGLYQGIKPRTAVSILKIYASSHIGNRFCCMIVNLNLVKHMIIQ